MIRRAVVRGSVVLAAVALVLPPPPAGGQPAGQPPAGPPDRVVVKKGAGTKTHEGFVRFGPTGVQVVGADGKVLDTVAPADVLKVTLGDVPGVDAAAVRDLAAAEDKKTKAEYEKARLGYDALKAKAGAAAPERVRRYLDYKLALTAGRAADETGYDEKWAEAAAPAAKGWGDFVANHKGGWEVWPATRAQARVYAELGRYDEAARAWGRLTKKDPELPADLRLEAATEEVDAQIRGGKSSYAAAAAGAKALLATAPAGQAKDRLAVYERAARAGEAGDFAKGAEDIEKLIAGTKDPAVRGVGYGMIGELHLAAGKPREAMWAFLWVETVYNADRDEAFKAACRLRGIFRDQKDEDRQKAYEEKLRRLRAAF